MIHNGKEVPFPAVMQVSFFKLFDQLEQMAEESEPNISNYAKSILDEMKDYPELRDGFEDLSLLEKNKDQIDKLCRLLFPDVLLTNEIKALCPPFYFTPLYSSTRYKNIMKDAGEDSSSHLKDVDPDMYYLYCCYFILGTYFGFPVPGGGHLNIQIFNKQQGITRTYKMAINADMVEFVPTDKSIMITQKDYEELVSNHGNLDLWKEKFPPNSWVMRGVNMVNLMDATIDESLSTITSNLLIKSTDSFERISNGVRSLFNSSKIQIGVLTMEKNNITRIDKDEVKSILLSVNKDECISCDSNMCDQTVNHLINQREPLIISDVDEYVKQSGGFIGERLKELKFKSFIMAPLCHEDRLLGFIELASYNRYELNSMCMARLNEVIPVLTMAHKRFSDESQNRIEAIIQQECTTIHSSVKWRFEQEAAKFMSGELHGENPVFKDIIFNNLYPLYGQMDIKGSSARRNETVKADLLKQLNGVKKVLKTALERSKMPAYEELIYQVDTFKRELSKELAAGSEHRILGFLKTEVYPVFDYFLNSRDQRLKKMVESYNELLDAELNTVYEERKKYDESVNIINQRLASYLDKKQQIAQSMFPHYF
ncbi:MAG: GAF domain-containing protein, partial [Bacteroidota bacterium]